MRTIDLRRHFFFLDCPLASFSWAVPLCLFGLRSTLEANAVFALNAVV